MLERDAAQVAANSYNRIFHVFSDDFVHTELRQRNFDMDSNIDNEIRLDHTNIDTKDVQDRLAAKERELAEQQSQFGKALEAAKDVELVGKASVNKRLREYIDIAAKELLTKTEPPSGSERTFKRVLADLEALKAIPAEPDYPRPISHAVHDAAKMAQVDLDLRRITSPSTVSEEIKSLLSANPEFFEKGLEIIQHENGDNCPFCRQELNHPLARNHIELYLAYFADAEGLHKKHLRNAWSEVKALGRNIADRASDTAKQILKFESLRRSLPSQKDVILPDLSGLFSELDVAYSTYMTAIATKGQAMATDVAIPDFDIADLVNRLNAQLDVLNAAFAALSAAINFSDNERKSLHREACHVFSAEFVHASWISITRIQALSKEAEEIRAELDALKRSQLSASVKGRVAQTFESLIQAFFGTKYSFDREAFVLKRNDMTMRRGASRTLSDGEKTAIAFCYFIACTHRKVKAASDYAKLFFVFDDPITSMSYDFVFAIAQTLKNLSINTSGDVSINPADIAKGKRPDLLVFTHSSYFYNICVTNFVVEKDAAFFLSQIGGEHKFATRTRYIAPFEQHLKEIVEVDAGREPDYTTGNAIRSVLEAIGRFCHPDKGSSLSGFIRFLAGEGGFQIRSVLINNLSHGTYYDEAPSPDELREACKEAILVVERYAKGQLELLRVAGE
jgi:wobble nucleotide-excising tRNase